MTHKALIRRLQISCLGLDAVDPLRLLVDDVIEALREHAMREVQRLGQEIEQDNIYGYASRLATAIWQKHYMKDAPKWKPFDTTEGVLTQIDNMTCGLVREKPAQQEPVKYSDYEPDGVHHNKPQQEPVTWKLMPRDATNAMLKAMDECSTEGYDERLYTGHAASVYMAAWDEAPETISKSKWVGLTEEEHTQIAIDAGCMSADWVFYGAAVERKLREKNTHD